MRRPQQNWASRPRQPNGEEVTGTNPLPSPLRRPPAPAGSGRRLRASGRGGAGGDELVEDGDGAYWVGREQRGTDPLRDVRARTGATEREWSDRAEPHEEWDNRLEDTRPGAAEDDDVGALGGGNGVDLSLIHISEPTRRS